VNRLPSVVRARPRLIGYLVPVAAVVVALLIGAIIILRLGASPIEAFTSMLDGAFGSSTALMNTAIKATPLLFVGAGIVIAFRANVINIGGEGQIVSGALLATTVALVMPEWPAIVALPVVLFAGVVGGAIWGAIPGALKAYYGVNEILSTIMLNVVAVQLMNFLLRGPLIDPAEIERGTRIPQTERLMDSVDLPHIVGKLHIGPLLAVLAAIATYYLMWRTPLGYRIRAVGLSRDASRYAGIQVKRTIVLAMTFSGALCGLAGAVLVFGSESLRMVTDGSTAGFTGSAGFNGIVAALFGGLHALWTIPASFLFGGLLVGGIAMQRAIQVPSALILALNGLVVVLVVSSDGLRRRLLESGSNDVEQRESDPAVTGGDADE
jgi:ABC-type uncharacterized transport system permease subunit